MPHQPVLRVLVVDDAVFDRRLMVSLLQVADGQIELSEAGSIGEAAAWLAEPHSADCLLLDLELPDAIGLSGLERLRSLAPHAAIVVLSGHDSPPMAEAAVAAGAQGYLVKGRQDADELLEALRRAVAVKHDEPR